MLKPIEVNFKLDKTIKRALITELMIKSHDINVIEFHITFDGLELTADHSVKVLSVFSDTKSQTNVNCDIVDGKAICRPDTSIISQYEHVLNYVYVYHGDQSLDVRLFTYSVDSSEIDKTAIKIKTVYDQSYAELLTEFEARLQDYKDSLPQASELRAEVDVILDKFKTDSVAKLSQYDADAQQVIADNQTAFNLAESNRQATYEQAEDSRNQASEQAVSDFVQTSNAQKDAKLGEIQTDAVSAISQFNQDGADEITDWRSVADDAVNNFNQNGNAEIVDWRAIADSELEEVLGGRVVLKNNLNTPTFTGLSQTFDGNLYTITAQNRGADQPRINFSLKTQPAVGDKLYTCLRTKTIMSALYRVFALGNATIVTPLKVDDLIFLSGIINYTAGLIVYKYESGASTVVGDTGQISKAIQINLTETFGAGNEPTKIEMDELIKITGYFDEITITQKQMLTWQLKLMRQNRNALIALGGTII